jgi:Na+/H+ antiporter NhaD/arsenite permease-like protein
LSGRSLTKDASPAECARAAACGIHVIRRPFAKLAVRDFIDRSAPGGYIHGMTLGLLRHIIPSRMMTLPITFVVLVALQAPALAADTMHLDGAGLSIIWALPFVGLLLSIALGPVVAPHVWHHHQGKISAFWALAFLVPCWLSFGLPVSLYEVLHTLILEYVPFLAILIALFTVAGGVLITGNLHGSPALNTGLLGIGTLTASFTGTTGASMLLIRPIIRANDNRRFNTHVVVFFIFLVANIGGSLTPLGDPPLFLGFLKGVSFFWPTVHLLAPMLLVAAILLAIFFLLDTWLYSREGGVPPRPDPTPDSAVGLKGWLNISLLAAVVAVVLASGLWKPGIATSIYGIEIELQNALRDIALLAIAWVSWRFTPTNIRADNGFTWGPVLEVAKLFAGIFITIIPAIAILRAGSSGALGGVVDLVTNAQGQPDNVMYFWLTGILSSFLDNAPTYLVFFNSAGGDAEHLMGPLATTLAAISAGAVFMGANTYIGNAPNFMVKAIAEDRGIRMPSFFGYMLWSSAILLPCFALVTWVFFWPA